MDICFKNKPHLLLPLLLFPASILGLLPDVVCGKGLLDHLVLIVIRVRTHYEVQRGHHAECEEQSIDGLRKVSAARIEPDLVSEYQRSSTYSQ